MKYTEKKAKEIVQVLVASGAIEIGVLSKDIIEIIPKIDEIIRDTRHKCAENIMSAEVEHQNLDGQLLINRDNIHNIVMNTNLD
jgi:hypothetical protein